MAEPARSRRSALEALILSLLGGAGLLRFLTPRGPGGRSSRNAVPVRAADVPPDGALVLPRHRCAVVRSGDSVMALDLTCPHLGCTVTATSQGFACPCHGSRFQSDGKLLEGPATRPLRRLEIERREDTLWITRGDGSGEA